MSLRELYIGCRTYRRFLQEPVPVEVMTAILENVRIMSCGRNGQVLRFYAVMQTDTVAAMQGLVHWAASLPPEIGVPKPGQQPTAFLVITKPAGAAGFTDVDVGIAADRICASAWEFGFGSCMMGAIDGKGIARLLRIPESEEVRLAVALGKPSHKSTVTAPPADGNLSYYVDDKLDYYVPKLPLTEIARFR